MKQLLMLMLISAITFGQLSAQSTMPIQKHQDIPEFMGIAVDGSKYDIINQLNEKGFKVNLKRGNVITFKGILNDEEIEIFALYTPKSEKCWKLAIFLPEKYSWYSLKEEYTKYLKILKDKYGIPSNEFSFFSSPYYEGDGYELTALRLEKCTYKTFWGNKIGLSISKTNQIVIGYENPINSEIDTKEKSQRDINTF